MTLEMMLDILERNCAHGVMVYDEQRRFVSKLLYLESTCRLRFWYFDEHGNVVGKKYADAPNGEMDLLNAYANEILNNGISCTAWC